MPRGQWSGMGRGNTEGSQNIIGFQISCAQNINNIGTFSGPGEISSMTQVAVVSQNIVWREGRRWGTGQVQNIIGGWGWDRVGKGLEGLGCTLLSEACILLGESSQLRVVRVES